MANLTCLRERLCGIMESSEPRRADIDDALPLTRNILRFCAIYVRGKFMNVHSLRHTLSRNCKMLYGPHDIAGKYFQNRFFDKYTVNAINTSHSIFLKNFAGFAELGSTLN